MSMERNKDKEDPNNPKEGAASGISRSSSTVADEGPKTTQATPEGDSIVDDKGHVTSGKNSDPKAE